MKFASLYVAMFLAAIAWSQIEHPKASPFSRLEQEVGLSKIIVEYSRPATKGRTIFGNRPDGQPGLVPYGRIWRVGANESTKITFDSDIEILNNILPKGTYALYAFPEADTWEIVFHTNISHWGDGRTAYNPEEDALRIKAKPIKTLDFQENFLISFDALSHDAVTMIWHWARTKIEVPIKINTREVMERQIQDKLKNNPTAQTYYEIARYYQEQGIKYTEALTYLNKAIALGGDTYYFYRVKSLVEGELKDYASAIQSAQTSLNLADKEGKDEFVRMNQKNIRRWKELVKNK
ncbi:DUF2911 domain-containing protein [Maribacter aestuarii]|uniref:DUF2911 domain-containing protein n=1 Tax=Maribacter aestuarii TaxID=1130723 RepID=UPI00248CB976|nr:DUF2911 domain-containing protein [Maribacter aestuarii]